MRRIVLAIVLLAGGSIAPAADMDTKNVLHRPIPDWNRIPPLAPLEWDSKKFGPVILVEEKGQMTSFEKTVPAAGWFTGYSGIKLDSKKNTEANLDAAQIEIPMVFKYKPKMGKVPVCTESGLLEQISKSLKTSLKNLTENKVQDVVIEIHLTRVDSNRSDQDGKVVVISGPEAGGSQSSDPKH